MNPLVIRTLRFLCFILLSQTLNGAVSAAPITVGFTGMITHLDDPGGVLDPSIAEAAFSGSYTIDPDLLSGEFRPPLPGASIYPLLPGGGSLSVSIAGFAFTLALPDIVIGNGSALGLCMNPCDAWTHTVSGPAGAIVPTILFTAPSGTKFISNDFFVVQELTGWEAIVQLVELYENDAMERRAVGVIRTLGVMQAPIPEPQTYALMLAGLALLGFSAARRRRGHRGRRAA